MDLKTLLAQLDKTQWQKRTLPRLQGPILTRYDLQHLKAPKGDYTARTSGSTGIPVEVQKTNLSKLWWNATNLREIIWHQRDLRESFAVIRPNILQPIEQPNWGPAFSLLGPTGKLFGHPTRGDLNRWLQEIQPGYLLTYPSILETIDLTALPSLKGIKTTGETLKQRHPLIADMYSCEEVGTIAIQCPTNQNAYHVMENIIIEILDDQNQPAQSGRVVVTDLTSLYLHRYDIGDYATVGVCSCGRGLQTLSRILGRERNQVLLPDGTAHWPRIGSLFYRDIAPIRRFQAAQVDARTLELRLIIDRPLDREQERKMIELIQHWIGYPFEIRFVYLDAFPPGKFEEFVNEFQVKTGHRSASS